MENSLAKYLNRDLCPVINGFTVVTGNAKETGNPWYALEITFINGYRKRIFLRDAEQFGVVNAIDLMDTQHQVDVNFNN